MLHRRIEEMAESLQDNNVVIDESWLLEFTETHQQYMESCSCQGVDFNVMGSTEDFLQFVLLHPKVQAVLRKLGGHDEVVGSSVTGHQSDTSRSSSLTFSPNGRSKLDGSVDKTAGESVLPDAPPLETGLVNTQRHSEGVEGNRSIPESAVARAYNITDLPKAESHEPERLEAESLAKVEDDQMAAEIAAKEEANRIAEAKDQDGLAIESAKVEAELVAKAESDRLAAEIAAKEECDRLAAEKEAAQVEAIRLASELAAGEEEAERLKQERVVDEELVRTEGEKLIAEIAAKEDCDRLATEKEHEILVAETDQVEAVRLASDLVAKEEETESLKQERPVVEVPAKVEAEKLAAAKDEAARQAAEEYAQEEVDGTDEERQDVSEAERSANEAVEGPVKKALVIEAETEKTVVETLSKGNGVEAVQSILGNDTDNGNSHDDQPGAGNRFGVQLRRNQSPVSEQTDGDRELLAKLEARRQRMASGGALSPRSRRAAAANDAEEPDFDGDLDGSMAGMTMQQKMAARRRRMEQVE